MSRIVQRQHTQRPADLKHDLLVTRSQLAKLFNCSVMTVIRLEQAGKLHPVRLNPGSENSRVHYRTSEIHALVQGGDGQGHRRVTAIEQLKPGAEILFSTHWFCDYPEGFYDPWTISLGPLPKVGYAPGTLRTAIVIAITENNGVLVKVTSGQQRKRKAWIPLARVWATTGVRFPVPKDNLDWSDDDLELRAGDAT